MRTGTAVLGAKQLVLRANIRGSVHHVIFMFICHPHENASLP